jgi:starvation-inducible DNA-binding protein
LVIILLGVNVNSLHPVRQNLPEPTRHQVVGSFNWALANVIHLGFHLRMAHWNIKGASFGPLHDLFGQIYEAIGCWTDVVAERVVQLGGTAMGSIDDVKGKSTLPVYPHVTAQTDHVSAVAESLRKFTAVFADVMATCNRVDDQVSLDIATEISRAADKWLWFVDSHTFPK